MYGRIPEKVNCSTPFEKRGVEKRDTGDGKANDSRGKNWESVNENVRPEIRNSKNKIGRGSGCEKWPKRAMSGAMNPESEASPGNHLRARCVNNSRFKTFFISAGNSDEYS